MAESEAQQQRYELAHVTRVAAMGELTSSLAHELNQPLAAILNYANAAQRFLSGGRARFEQGERRRFTGSSGTTNGRAR